MIRYRQGVVHDLMHHPDMRTDLANLVPAIRSVAASELRAFEREVPKFVLVGKRMTELERYVRVLRSLNAALIRSQPQREALRALAEEVTVIANSDEFRSLAGEVPRWRTLAESVRCIRIAINVSPLLVPESAVVLDISDQQVPATDGFLARSLGTGAASRGLAHLRLHSPVDWAGKGILTKDVADILHAVTAPIERALAQYRRVQCQALLPLADELEFYLRSIAAVVDLQARGLPWCLPEVVEADNGEPWGAHEAYYPPLAVEFAATGEMGRLVRNDVSFAPEGQIWVLTGPNRGGKTTYLRTIGTVQVLAQLGLAVPARSARVRVRDGVYTHFPVPEADRTGMGRLDEEAARIRALLDDVTDRSLVLLNETFSGTSAPEGFALAWDVLRGFRAIGVDLVYATHLHDVARRCKEIETTPGRSAVGSLVARASSAPKVGEGSELGHSVDALRPTYTIERGEPAGATYFASEIARQHGLTFAQILARRTRRTEGV